MSFQEYRMISFNVNGLQNPIKRKKIATKMRGERHDIVFWQETHLNNMEHEQLKRLGFKHVYYSLYRQKCARGVTILIANKINFQLIQQIRDRKG